METCLALSAASLHYGCKNPGPVVTRRNIKSGHHPVPQTGPPNDQPEIPVIELDLINTLEYTYIHNVLGNQWYITFI